MNFVGVDLHKHSISVCTMVQAGTSRQVTARRRFRCEDEEQIQAFFAELGPFEVVVEATASYEWFVKLVEPLARRVVLAHPKKLRVIAESAKKSDKLDAQTLAEFLALDMVPTSWRPTPRVREHRTLVRLRYYTQRRITATKNKLRRVLADYNADIRSLFTRQGRRYLGITKEGSRLLRWALVQAAWRLVNRTRRWSFLYERLKARTGAKKAIVAVARRVWCVMVAMLKSGTAYRAATA